MQLAGRVCRCVAFHMVSFAHVRRHWHTIRFLHPRQIAARISLRCGVAWRRLVGRAASAAYETRARRADLHWMDDPWHLRGAGPDALARLSDEARARLDRQTAHALSGRFVFLHEQVDGRGRADWRASGLSQLARYHLHYFDYLPEAMLSNHRWEEVEGLARDWIAHNPLGPAATRDAWHPYVASLRAVNWMLTLALAPPAAVPAAAWRLALTMHVMFIEGNLETDVGGNHLLKNLKALAMAGCFFGGRGAAHLRTRYVPGFVSALERQLRSDGGHYEQSPMYHAQVLVDAAELAIVLRRSGHDVPQALDRCLTRMARFLVHVCHPDGQFAQFGDSAFNMTPPPAEVGAAADLARGLATSGPWAVRHLPFAVRQGGGTVDSRDAVAPPTTGALSIGGPHDGSWDPAASGVCVLASADRRGHLVADFGPVCPDELPAHAHSDLFGFEVSIDARRLIVDTGVSEYRGGRWRDYERSTRAHSTVAVDAREQSECWGSFRVAERAHVVGGRRFATPDFRGVAAAHDGYERLAAPVRHTRAIAFIDELAWLVVDRLDGAGRHHWETYLHLHPAVALTSGPGGEWILDRETSRLRVLSFGLETPTVVRGSLDPVHGWYAPEFGRREPSSVLTSRGSGPVPVTFGWLLVPGDIDAEVTLESDTDPYVRVRLAARTHDVPLAVLTLNSARSGH